MKKKAINISYPFLFIDKLDEKIKPKNFIFPFIEEVITELDDKNVSYDKVIQIVEKLYNESNKIYEKTGKDGFKYYILKEGETISKFVKNIVKDFSSKNKESKNKEEPTVDIPDTIKSKLIEIQMSIIIEVSNFIKDNLIDKYIKNNKSKNINIKMAIIKLFTNRISYIMYHLFDVINNINFDSASNLQRSNIQIKF